MPDIALRLRCSACESRNLLPFRKKIGLLTFSRYFTPLLRRIVFIGRR